MGLRLAITRNSCIAYRLQGALYVVQWLQSMAGQIRLTAISAYLQFDLQPRGIAVKRVWLYKTYIALASMSPGLHCLSPLLVKFFQVVLVFMFQLDQTGNRELWADVAWKINSDWFP